MYNKIQVYIISQKHDNFLLSEMKNLDNIIIKGITINFTEAEKYLTNNKKTIAVIVYEPEIKSQSIRLLKFCKENKIRTLAISNNAKEGFELLKHGALEMMVWPEDEEILKKAFLQSAKTRLKILNNTDMSKDDRVYKLSTVCGFDKIIAIGSSTGGTTAVEQILLEMPANSPPILIVQHMPPVFTKLYAERMTSICKVTVWEARDGDELRAGLVLIAPGDKQMKLEYKNNKYFVSCKEETKVNGHCPSVDVLFNSIAKTPIAQKTLGIILTGMGGDGAKGLLNLRTKGALTIGQNKESCAVYGMPKVAKDIGAVTQEMHLNDIPKFILENI